jgi:acetyl esterase/lipase
MSARPVNVTTAISPAWSQVRCDQDMQELLQAYDRLAAPAFHKRMEAAFARRLPCLADAVRALRRQRAQAADDDGAPQAGSRDLTLRTSAGPLTARIYTPASEAPLPLVLYFHGGGWVVGSIDADDATARGLAAHAQALVVSVQYRLAPEHRFPAAWEDALAAYEWLLGNAACLQGDATRIAIAGEGAGGHLALSTTLEARNRGLPMPRHVLAISPVTQTSTNTASYLEHAIARPLDRATMVWFFDKLVALREELQDPRLLLVDADLAGLPPVTLVTARIDPLRSDAAKLRDALLRAGVPVEWRDYEGVTNGFFNTAAVVARARQAHAYAGQRLAAALMAPGAEPGRRRGIGEFRGALRHLLPQPTGGLLPG